MVIFRGIKQFFKLVLTVGCVACKTFSPSSRIQPVATMSGLINCFVSYSAPPRSVLRRLNNVHNADVFTGLNYIAKTNISKGDATSTTMYIALMKY